MSGGSTNPKPVMLARVGVLLAVLLTYWPVLTCSLEAWDDAMNVTDNPSFNPPTARKVLRYWIKPSFDIYAPLTFTAWGAISTIAYDDDRPYEARWSAWPFHAANLIVHAVAAVVVFELLRRVSGSLAGGVLGAVLFAMHPLAVEPVAWASGLKDVLAGMLGLAALLLYFPRPATARYVTATVLFLFALLAKPSAVVLPAMALLLDIASDPRDIRRAVLRALPWFALAIPFVVIGRFAQPAAALGNEIPLSARPLVALDALGFYLTKLLWPLRLGADYGRTPHTVVARGWDGSVLWMIPFLALAAVISLARIRKSITPLFLAALFVAAPAPTLGLLPFDFQIYSTVADHYAYLALLAPAVAVALIVARYDSTEARTVGAVLCVLLAILSFRQTWTWRTSRSISEQTLVANPQSWAAHANLARLDLRGGRPDDALAHAQAAVRFKPDWPNNHYLLGQAHSARRQFAEAQAVYRKLLENRPDDVAALAALADALADGGDRPAAIRVYQDLLRRSPRETIALSNLAGLHAESQDFDEAIHTYDRVLAIDPNFPPALAGRQRAVEEQQRRARQQPQ